MHIRNKSGERGKDEKKKKKGIGKKKIFLPLIGVAFLLLLFVYLYKRPSGIDVTEVQAPAAPRKIEISPGDEGKGIKSGGVKDKGVNSPPVVVKAILQPAIVNGTAILKVMAEGRDNDGDTITYGYEWTKNNEPAGEGNSISGFRRKDKLSVKITPFDGKDYGQPRIVITEIKNTPPEIIGHREMSFDGKLLTYEVRASDPDGDVVSYSLEEAPGGMTINSANGLINWVVNPGDYGKHGIRVKVSDGQGGEASCVFDVEVKEVKE